ncbi:hypothetical protein AURDEDRAFT_183990 [Auricularia subglabra TFB-10046 SS5]|nr:hypothetical protein AURDEDRAFT_183990 [Auricularia subglabra TFB-10046 SS5]
MSSVAARAPADVLRLIFEFLDQPAVLATAAVSRTWRATAVLDHSYYRAWAFLFPAHEKHIGDSRAYNSNILDLVPIVRDAERRHYKLSLSLQFHEDLNHSRTLDELERDDHHAANFISELWDDARELDVLRVRRQVAPVVRYAVPRLVRLDIRVEPFLALPLLGALDVPAPNLRDLIIQVFQLDELQEHGLLPPSGLFAGFAPLMESAGFVGVHLWEQMPCFPSVRHLRLNFEHIAGQLRLAADCFPRVQELGLSNLHRPPNENISAEELRLYGQLDYLNLGPHLDPQTLVAALPAIVLIPEIEFRCTQNTEVLAPVLCTPGPSILSISEVLLDDQRQTEFYGRFSYLLLEVESPQTVRRMDVYLPYDATFRILGEASVAATLTKVFIDDRHVRSLMSTYSAMPLLEELTITLVAWCAPTPGSSRKRPDEPSCGCPISDFAALDTRPPDQTLVVNYPRLSTVLLRATHADATVGAGILQALAHSFGGPRIVLKDGLSALVDDSDTAPAARNTGADSEVFDSTQTARVAKLLQTAAKRGDRVHALDCPHFRRWTGPFRDPSEEIEE